MKKGKLLLLLVAIMSLAVTFAACDESAGETGSGSETEASTGAATDIGTGTDTQAPLEDADAEETIAEVKDEQESVQHELLDYFDLPEIEEPGQLTSISRLEGSIVYSNNEPQIDTERNLAVVETKELDNLNYVIHTMKVYDLLSDEVVLTESVSYPYMGDQLDRTELSVTLEEYVIRVSKLTYTLDEGDDPDSDLDDTNVPNYNVTYYPIKGGNVIYQTDSNVFETQHYGNGFVRFRMGDKDFWIDKNYNTVRTMDAIIAGNYDIDFGDNFSEYKGYIYSWNETRLFVFNRGGKVSGIFDAAEKSKIDVHVLNDGNVLIQEFTKVGATESCDFTIQGTRYTMQSYIMNFIGGEKTEIEEGLGFIVDRIVTRYEQQDMISIDAELANGVDSYAVVYRIANGEVAVSPVIYVLDNELNILYTVENSTFGVDLGEEFALMGNGRFYSSVIKEGNQEYNAIFDYDGNLISPYRIGGFNRITSKYVVSDTALYDYGMNCVYEFSKNGYVFDAVVNDDIYLTKRNFETGKTELYVIKTDSKAPELVCDGVDYTVDVVGERYFSVYDIENDVYRLYNVAGEELLVTHEPISYAREFEDVMLFATAFNGEDIVYVVK